MSEERTSTAVSFRTPPRILIPKLVRSRDAWKAKATRRKQQRKALLIRVRDLSASRLRHRQRADRLARELEQVRLQLRHTQQQLQQLRLQQQARPVGVACSTAPPAGDSPGTPKKTRP